MGGGSYRTSCTVPRNCVHAECKHAWEEGVQDKLNSAAELCVCAECKHAWEEGRTEQAAQCRGIVCTLSASTHGRRAYKTS